MKKKELEMRMCRCSDGVVRKVRFHNFETWEGFCDFNGVIHHGFIMSETALADPIHGPFVFVKDSEVDDV
jgi:hypothetical protein